MSALWLALLPALPLLLPAPTASAQLAGSGATTTTGAGTISWVLTKVGDTAYTDTSYKIPINKSACDSDGPLHVSLSNIPPGFKYLEVWVGDNCTVADRATRVGSTLCTFVLDKEQDVTNTLDTDFQIPLEQACILGDGARSIWVLAVSTEKTSGAATAYAQITLNFDTTPPSPPTSVKGGAGQTQIPVSWSQPSDAYYYWVVVDTNVNTGDIDAGTAEGSECASAALQPGMDFDPTVEPLPAGITVKYINEKASRTTLSSDDIGVTEGAAAVSVMAEDLGHNRSELSNIACLDIVPTTGFWTKYRAAGGEADQGCGCAIPGTPRRDAQLMWPVLFVFGVLGVWRRARRRA